MKNQTGSENDQAGKLAELIENIVYRFGTHGIDGECCETISHGEFRALRAAFHQKNCTMQEIARSAVVTKSGATRIVRRLAEKGLVNREQDPQDGRICCVTLTRDGKSLLARIEERLRSDMKSILKEIDPAMREVLILSLSEFAKTAERLEETSYEGDIRAIQS